MTRYVLTLLKMLALLMRVVMFGAEPERLSDWKQIEVVPLKATLHHVQGIDVEGDLLWVSSVDAKLRKGYLSRFDRRTGELQIQVEVHDGARLHPGGIMLDGDSIWVPVAEYKAKSTSWIERRDKRTLQLLDRFEVQDHIGCIAVCRDQVVGGNWDSLLLYRWTKQGKEIRFESNGTATKFQDLKCDKGKLIGSGVRTREQGAIEWIGESGRSTRSLLVGRTDRGVLFTNEGMTIREGQLYLLPEDDPSRLFVFRKRD